MKCTQSFLCEERREKTHFLVIAVWPGLAKFHHFGMTLKNFGHFERVHLNFGKIFKLFCYILYAIGQIYIAANGQKLNKQSINLVTVAAIYLNTGMRSA